MRPASEIMGVPAISCKGARTGAVCFVLLGPDGEAVAVPVEDLEAVAAAVGEDEEVSGEGVELQDALSQRRQAVEALAHVSRLGGEVDADGGAQSEHGGASSTPRSRRRVSG